MIARLGAVIFVLLTMAFVVAAIVYGNSDPGGDPDAIRQHERMYDLLRAAAFCSFICALFFGAMAELKRELEGIHTTLALSRPSVSQSPPDAPVAMTTVTMAAAAQASPAQSGNGKERRAPEAPVAAAPLGEVHVQPHLQRWFVAGRDAEDRESAFAAAVARGLKEVTSLEPRQRPHD